MADEHESVSPRCQSVCAVEDIIGKTKGLARVKKCITQETNIKNVLVEKILQFKLPIPHTSALEQAVPGLYPLVPPTACCPIWPQTEYRSSGQTAGKLRLWGGSIWKRGAYESVLHMLAGEDDRGEQTFPRLGR